LVEKQGDLMDKSAILKEILALNDMKSNELIWQYKRVFGNEKPSSTNPGHLRRKIAYKLQEITYGELSDKALVRVNEFIKMYDPINNKQLRQRKDTGSKAATPIRDRRLPIPGSIIAKDYKGRAIKVRVLEKGFEYNNKPYRSLSQIAIEITGDHWNGYLFFNL